MKRSSKKRAVAKITGLTVEINTAPAKAAGARPRCTELAPHTVAVSRERERSLIVFAVTAKHAGKKEIRPKKRQYNNKARVVHNMRLIQGRRVGQKVEVAHSVLLAAPQERGQRKESSALEKYKRTRKIKS